MQLNYLDTPSERGSEAILTSLSCHLFDASTASSSAAAASAAFEVSATGGRGKPLSVEHKRQGQVSYVVTKGIVAIDVRDSADCWLRVSIPAGERGLTLPPNIYRRLVSVTEGAGGPSPLVVEESEQSMGGGGSNQILTRYAEEGDSVEVVTYHNYRELVCELCRQFFDAGWVTGTGGSISIRHGNRIYMTPSGVQKERILPDELYVLDIKGDVISVPARKPGVRAPKLSDCSPLFMHAFQQRNAGAVLHSHAFCCNLVTSMFEGEGQFRISHQEMIKGIDGYGYFDELCIPIIENTAWEHELADSLGEAIAKNPRACAVLVRRHGMYVWGNSWEQAKRHGECLHYLFEVAINMRRLGMDFLSPPLTIHDTAATKAAAVASRKRGTEEPTSSASPNKRRNASSSHTYKHVVFDIEGTTTPITFVKDILFPYSASHVKAFLDATWTSQQTQADVASLTAQSLVDASGSTSGSPVVTNGSKQASLASLEQYVQWSISQDSKSTALKQLQGRIWEEGYTKGEITSIVYDDVPACFERLRASGSQISIYSSGSRSAQRLLFKHSNHGDLRSAISCYFDTKVGTKREAESYREILTSLGCDAPEEVLFVTDIIQEAQAATEAGLHAVLSVRPGNEPLPTSHPFRCVSTFDDL